MSLFVFGVGSGGNASGASSSGSLFGGGSEANLFGQFQGNSASTGAFGQAPGQSGSLLGQALGSSTSVGSFGQGTNQSIRQPQGRNSSNGHSGSLFSNLGQTAGTNAPFQQQNCGVGSSNGSIFGGTGFAGLGQPQSLNIGTSIPNLFGSTKSPTAIGTSLFLGGVGSNIPGHSLGGSVGSSSTGLFEGTEFAGPSSANIFGINAFGHAQAPSAVGASPFSGTAENNALGQPSGCIFGTSSGTGTSLLVQGNGTDAPGQPKGSIFGGTGFAGLGQPQNSSQFASIASTIGTNVLGQTQSSGATGTTSFLGGAGTSVANVFGLPQSVGAVSSNGSIFAGTGFTGLGSSQNSGQGTSITSTIGTNVLEQTESSGATGKTRFLGGGGTAVANVFGLPQSGAVVSSNGGISGRAEFAGIGSSQNSGQGASIASTTGTNVLGQTQRSSATGTTSLLRGGGTAVANVPGLPQSGGTLRANGSIFGGTGFAELGQLQHSGQGASIASTIGTNVFGQTQSSGAVGTTSSLGGGGIAMANVQGLPQSGGAASSNGSIFGGTEFAGLGQFQSSSLDTSVVNTLGTNVFGPPRSASDTITSSFPANAPGANILGGSGFTDFGLPQASGTAGSSLTCFAASASHADSLHKLPPRPTLSSARPLSWMRPPRSASTRKQSLALPPTGRASSEGGVRAHCRGMETRGSLVVVDTALAVDPTSILRVATKRLAPDCSMASMPCLEALEDNERPSKIRRKDSDASLMLLSICGSATPQRRSKIHKHQFPSSDAESSPTKTRLIKPTFVRHLAQEPQQECETRGDACPKLAPSLTREGYFCCPSVLDMSLMSEAQLEHIDNFEICRHGFGSIVWPGVTDVRGVDLDQVISIGEGAITAFPNDPLPPVGTGLNKSAVISLRVKRVARSQREATMLQERIQLLTEKAGHKFISYDLDTWIFSVPDFEAPSHKKDRRSPEESSVSSHQRQQEVVVASETCDEYLL